MARVLIIMSGVPGSGNSYCAKEVIPVVIRNNTIIKNNECAYYSYVSRDSIRFSLLDEEDSYFAKENEVYKEFIKSLIYPVTFYDEGEDLYVVADATHINKYSRKKLYDNVKDWFDSYVVINIETPLEVCLERNAEREDRFKVPEHTIRKMYKDYKPAEYDNELFEIDKILCYNGITKEMKEVDRNE